MNEKPVLYDVNAGVATITLNRPDVLNALSAELMADLRDSVDRAAADPNVRSVLVTGAGRAFCAGADLASVGASSGPRDSGATLRDRYHPVILAMRAMPKPIVSAVNGVAAGAGMSIALAGDIIVAAESASFLQAFSRIGLIPDAGSTWFLPRLAGDLRARALAMLAERIPADDALRYGIVWKVFPDSLLQAEARAMAEHLARMPTRAYAFIKQALDASSTNDLAAQLELEARLQTEAGRTEDAAEGVAAFLQKRPPSFTGR
jgi:2-(1,2-epoxy-1,2-dihydrophenyl)acetyl-CoA isomerase